MFNPLIDRVAKECGKRKKEQPNMQNPVKQKGNTEYVEKNILNTHSHSHTRGAIKI